MKDMTIAKHPTGRILLHLACLVRDGKLRWHWSFVRREIHGMHS